MSSLPKTEIARSDERHTPDHGELFVPTLVPWKTKLSRSLRFKLFLTGVVFPVICLGMIVFGARPDVRSPWQSGELVDHVIVFLSYPAIAVFFPLLLFHFVAMAVWCFRPETFRFAPIRVGIYSGAITALMFNVVLAYVVAFVPLVFALIVAPILALIVWGAGWLMQQFFRKRFSILYLLVVTAVCSVALALGIPWIKANPRIGEMIFAPVILILASAAPLGFITFARVSRAIFHLQARRSEDSSWSRAFPIPLKKTIGVWIAWIVSMVTSWKYALEIEAAEYAKLPTTDPNCYVSAAAAHGHRNFVGSMERVGDVCINLQMKRLKFLEFALATSLPRAHRWIRAIYNRVGPKLAKACRMNAWFADLTYVGLKPLELSAELVRRITGVPNGVVLELYELGRDAQATSTAD